MKLSLFVALTLSVFNGVAQYKMITFYTPSHTDFYENYFIPSFKLAGLEKTFDLEVHEFDQESAKASYMSEGWNSTMMRKVELILDTIDKNWGEVFVYADIDIQFFKDFVPEKYLGSYDIVLQQNQLGSDRVCAGFFIAKANNTVRSLWKNVKQQMLADARLDDQEPLNRALNSDNKIKMSLLPYKFFNPALDIGPSKWLPGTILKLPKDIILHHANWTIGIENKIKQLDYLKSLLTAKV